MSSKTPTKYVFVTGGVVSGLGKGITAASIGRLLKARGVRVTMQKLDPYLNIDPGTMSPYQHGEVFVTDDGAETDLDLGHYERFIDESLNQYSNVTSGRVFDSVLKEERSGSYEGGTVQMIPHITNKIKENIRLNVETANADVAIIEVGGTVGDIESLPFIEAIRQFGSDVGRENCVYVHVTLVPYLAKSCEIKTKPTQHSIRELLSQGIQADVIVCRTEVPLPYSARRKISQLCNVPVEMVIENLDLDSLYAIPLALEQENLCQIIVDKLKLVCAVQPDLTDWQRMVDTSRNLKHSVRIALVGKYVALHDAYLSVVEALKHGGFANNAAVDIKWVDSEDITPQSVGQILGDVDGVLVPGGFGNRGIEGKILAARYVRENGKPYFGICLGMQIALIEFARDVLGWEGANSTEFDDTTPYPVIDFLPGQREERNLGGTLRLGLYPCALAAGSHAHDIYGQDLIHERHRHRYEVNNDYLAAYESAGLVLCGAAPDKSVIEMLELPEHPWFVACQFHPEFRSRPNKPHPLFASFIGASLAGHKK
ncbi:MAG TPA: CTP synthase [Candidatus Avidehalobacter gallistercoris]|uniref:CTP synthase n=1 Tax=Candidatus Avidehalobacter gallistercoris TaxID=2840694 RepID=A0A9D1HJZ4_9FIRM|nr:CTP synthase [Candidatus Avidehalobacter gallistercoris]